MCCEICPRYISCEEEGHLNDLCCISCPEHASCNEDSKAKNRDEDTLEDELDEI